MNNKKLVKNYIYNMIYQFLLIVLPLVTLPYLSRILGSDGIGTYSYVVAITAYFILIGTLGLNLYGQKEIAYVQDSVEKRSKKFIELFILKSITLTQSLIVFYIFFVRSGEYSGFYKILIIEIIGNIFDITWFFQGMEEFKKTVVRNSAIKIISTILIFLLIKEKSDLYLYFIIYAVSIFLGNLSMWFYIPKYVKKVKIEAIDVLKNLKPAIVLLIPQVATQIYTVLDKSMIGNLASSINEVGYYDNAQKIIKVGITLTTAMGTVMLPRISNSFSKNQKKEINENINNSFLLVFLISFPIIFGLLAVGDNFVPLFFGPGFNKVSSLIKFISPVILLIGMSNILGIQYLLPTKQNKPYIIAVIMGAIVNVSLNLILISRYNALGACIATICAELIVFLIEFIYLYKTFKFKQIFKEMLKYLFAASVMYIICLVIHLLIKNSILFIFSSIIIGGILYISILYLLREKYVMTIIREVKNKIENKIS